MVEAEDIGWSVAPLVLTFLSVFSAVYVIVTAVNRSILRKNWKKNALPVPPFIASLPFIGSLLFMRCGGLFHRFFANRAKTLGPIFTCRLGSKMALVLNDRKSIEEALIKKSFYFSSRHAHYTFDKYYNTNYKGIAYRQTDANFTRDRRQVMEILKEMGMGRSLMEERIQREVEELLVHLEEQKGKPFNPQPLVTRCTLNVVTSVLFGKRLEQSSPTINELAENVYKFLHMDKQPIHYCPPLRFLPYYRRIIQDGFRYLGGILRFIGDSIEASLEPGAAESFVERYVSREGPGYDREDLRYTCRDLIDAGTDTSSVTILWCLVELANNGRVQRRLHDQIDSVIPSDRLPFLADIPAIPFAEAILLETWRRWAPLPLSLPHKCNVDTELRGYHIPSGTMVLPNIHAVHMNVDEWGDPEIFRPERFLNESEDKVSGKDRIFPFSLGKRSCIGEVLARAEVFLLLVAIMKRFEVRPPEGQSRVECVEVPSLIVAPSEFSLRLLPRHR